MSDRTSEHRNVGHGHVFPRPDGVKARCGGPAICHVCAIDQARKDIQDSVKPNTTSAAMEAAGVKEAERFTPPYTADNGDSKSVAAAGHSSAPGSIVAKLRSYANGCEGFDDEARVMMQAAAEIERLSRLLGTHPERAQLCDDGHPPIVHFDQCPVCAESPQSASDTSFYERALPIIIDAEGRDLSDWSVSSHKLLTLIEKADDEVERLQREKSDLIREQCRLHEMLPAETPDALCDGEVRVIYEHGEPTGVRDRTGFLCFFNRVTKYEGQEDRYQRELALRARQAEAIANALRRTEKSNDYTKVREVMNPPESAAQGSEAGNLTSANVMGLEQVHRAAEARPAEAAPLPDKCEHGIPRRFCTAAHRCRSLSARGLECDLPHGHSGLHEWEQP